MINIESKYPKYHTDKNFNLDLKNTEEANQNPSQELVVLLEVDRVHIQSNPPMAYTQQTQHASKDDLKESRTNPGQDVHVMAE
ncbi:hypothetical protein C1H46_017585 [Malus baccata]|uniref:Uncharacterized protein n=1 Tax=Malus baccata TaxID=106549 RepID=A0A540MDN1_MALBA|nr:hypothetical protein C1H46_017585 [Malus baccata]